MSPEIELSLSRQSKNRNVGTSIAGLTAWNYRQSSYYASRNFQVSAKEAVNVEQAFQAIAHDALQREMQDVQDFPEFIDHVRLNAGTQYNKRWWNFYGRC